MSVAALDAGTTGVRCMVVDDKGNVISVSRRPWMYETPEFFEVAKEFKPAAFWNYACTVIREAVTEAAHRGYIPEAIATTSQRQGMVILDAEGEELHGGPNIDARGSMTQYIIEDEIGEQYHSITGCWPPMMFAPSRIAWFEEEEPEIHAKIAHILPISDWLTYRLSDTFVTEPSSASATGFYDIQENDWSKKILDIVGFGSGVLPEIKRAGVIVGEVTRKASLVSTLPEGLPVVQGGTDTHCALLAARVGINEIGIIAGSTGPVMLVTDNPSCDSAMRIWTGAHMIPGQWTVESNATMTGALLEWVVKLLCEQSENPEACESKTFNNLDANLADIPPGSYEAISGLGPTVMNASQITSVPLARIYFPQPALPSVKPLDSTSLIHSVIENIAFSIRGNCEQLYEVSKIGSIKTIGGMTRSNLWGQMLANVLGREIRIPEQSEGSLLGAAICAAAGVKIHKNIDSAADVMVVWKDDFTPDERTQEYEGYYSKWREIWLESE